MSETATKAPAATKSNKAAKADPITDAAKVATATGAPVDVSEQLPLGPTGERYDGVPQVRKGAEVMPSGIVRETF
jgi:hypothetical protein